MSEEFAIGQRWVSHSEAELGLGIVAAIDGRRLQVDFPAAEASRMYAIDNAPLSRVSFQVGEHFKDADGRKMTVKELQEFNGCMMYLAEDPEGQLHTVHEMHLHSAVQFSEPQQRLFAGQIDKNSQFELRLKALEHHHRIRQSPLFGLMGARAQLLPHQFYIAATVAQRYAPRVLLADEVGLGKTIEAGLILHQQLLTGRARRALIVVPESLLHQWLVEMLRRFNLSFTIIDSERFIALEESESGNPFDSSQLVIVSLQNLQADPAMQEAMLAAQWDMLIVDEAHHLHWQPDNASEQYQLIATLAEKIASVLLLTATPQQLGLAGHFARLRLLDPQRYHDLSAFEQEQKDYAHINALLEQLLDHQSAETLQNDAALIKALSDKLDDRLLTKLQLADDFESAQQQAKQQLLDQFGTGRLLFRNSRETITGFPERQLITHPLTWSEQVDSSTLQTMLRPETALGENWLQTDSRVAWLVSFLKEQRGQKILLICGLADTAEQLEQFLRVQHGVRSAVFHEGMSLLNRDRAAAYFADDEEGAQVLICSEIGSEGRNFQFCHQLICFDLPSSPDLLEQRIGRLDRIGQRQTVQIHVPFYQDSSQQRLLDWYHQGINGFEQVQKTGEALLAEFAEPLALLLATPEDSAAAETLIKDTAARRVELNSELQKGRDKLLESHSFDADVAEQVLAELEAVSRPMELADFISDFSDAFGVEHQIHSADSVILQAGDQMQQHDLPGLPEDGITGTYQRHKALSREDMAFFTWEHPLVANALDAVVSSDLGNSTFCTLSSETLPAGSLLLEAVFSFEVSAPATLNIPRYLEQQCQRLLVDEKGRDLSATIEQSQLAKEAGRIPKATTRQLVNHARSRIESLLTLANKQIDTLTKDWVTAAEDKANQLLDNELSRLQQLALRNNHIRPEEISYLEKIKADTLKALQSAQWRLDAIRVVIITGAD
ncbi:RNA polymerase-associated protein RapA [Methylophaga sp. OBS3]|uniref:RNA polymerase-associated protein RapA n=1 Tax=Methylophaga sp. OBS3 TaxID=2991934 RepID=UPI002250E812|nr:RNA polymerase-associated protein RapA [Methylophaga sp. OBS3]MCX4189218.1 RNA polymerase-associated protein RapA [Methylophaga sp. OBS3]